MVTEKPQANKQGSWPVVPFWLNWRLRFVALAVIWGLSFFFIDVGLQALSPLQITLGRMACGASVLLVIVALRRDAMPRGWRMWGHLSVAALILNVVPFTLYGYAEQRIPSALAGIINATAPLFTLLVAMLVLSDERPTRQRVLGLAIGFAGVVVVLGAWNGMSGVDNLVGALLALAAPVCYGAGWPYLRRFLTDSGYSSIALSASQLLTGALELAIVTPFLTTMPTVLPAQVVLAVVVLGAVGTGVAYVLQYGLVRTGGATTASTVTYVIPVVSTAAGVVLLDERLTWNALVGAVVVILGTALSRGQIRFRQYPRRQAGG